MATGSTRNLSTASFFLVMVGLLGIKQCSFLISDPVAIFKKWPSIEQFFNKLSLFSPKAKGR